MIGRLLAVAAGETKSRHNCVSHGRLSSAGIRIRRTTACFRSRETIDRPSLPFLINILSISPRNWTQAIRITLCYSPLAQLNFLLINFFLVPKEASIAFLGSANSPTSLTAQLFQRTHHGRH
jgi:hypothetical protein